MTKDQNESKPGFIALNCLNIKYISGSASLRFPCTSAISYHTTPNNFKAFYHQHHQQGKALASPERVQGTVVRRPALAAAHPHTPLIQSRQANGPYRPSWTTAGVDHHTKSWVLPGTFEVRFQEARSVRPLRISEMDGKWKLFKGAL